MILQICVHENSIEAHIFLMTRLRNVLFLAPQDLKTGVGESPSDYKLIYISYKT